MSEAEKTICRTCKQCTYIRGTLYCEADPTILTNWSTGKKEVVLDVCDHVNVHGECGMYVYQPTIREEFAAWMYGHNWIGWLILIVLAVALLCLHFKIWGQVT